MFVVASVVVLLHLVLLIHAQDLGKPCVTPNGENATCISVESCPVIKKALTYLNPVAVRFAQESQCGYEEEGPLVCCGSVGRFTTPAPVVEKTTPRQNIILELPPAVPIENNLLPDLSLCGLQIENGGVGNGSIAKLGEHPWLVALHYQKNDNSTWAYKCSGVLISEKYVVTLAECLQVTDYTLKAAQLGKWSLSSQTDESQVNVKIGKTFKHPYYNARRRSYNIALLRLKETIKYSDQIRPICLPPNDFPSPVSGTIMQTAGWSLTEKGERSDLKLTANIMLLSYGECEKEIEDYELRFYPAMVCAKSISSNPLCNGESGIPLIMSYEHPKNTAENLEPQYYLEGLITNGFGCNVDGKPSLYMRVSRYVTWIINNIEP